ncbi:uncharacterized protein BJX67DRAFT_167727 [Aspergillus lucknowensis]|uniref:Zn(2)-C6 fungal-type domain-containing protein n=1 Tax=Aspergillus lucknowensis TaxID=176173 RepID=A0ABR4M528_9EURO
MADVHPEITSSNPLPSAKPQRVLSCVLCQQRKVRCDRTFPCANCLRAKVQCIPASQVPRRRKRRFPERELLGRLREYESLLRQNDIKFNPLHGEPVDNAAAHGSPGVESADERQPDSSRPSASPKSTPKSFWHAINQLSPEPDIGASAPPPSMTETVVKKAWDQAFGTHDPLFGAQDMPGDLSELHPQPSQIFRLWQIYLDNVDPLFKVTHTPTLQSRIIEAIGDLKNNKPPLDALMFSIYCIATLSVMPYECDALIGPSRDDVLAGYQVSCRKALVRAQFLRSDDRDCLTALYLYLVSLRPTADPRTMSSMLGIAIRSAQRMGIHDESTLSKYSPFEAEMRRRLWWALVLFDTRIGEMADYRTTTLTPLWDCKIPLNVNDSDLRPEMTNNPVVQGRSSEALFAVVRSEVGDFLRNSSFHLEFSCPALKSVARTKPCSSSEADELAAMETLLEDKYLQSCDPENPLHFITMWTTRAALAKCSLVNHYSKYSPGRQTEAQRDAAVFHALRMLDCDTNILSSSSVKRYFWLMHFYFPFPAYLHILQDLRKRPLSRHAEQSWTSLSKNFEARAHCLRHVSPNLLFRTITSIVFHAWESAESAVRQAGRSPVTPTIVSTMKHWLSQGSIGPGSENTSETAVGGNTTLWPTQVNTALGFQDPAPAMAYPGLGPWFAFDIAEQTVDSDGQNQPDWSFLSWGL